MTDRTLNDEDLAGFARRIAFRSRETLEAQDRAWVYLPDFSAVVIAEALLVLKTIVQHERQAQEPTEQPFGEKVAEA